MARRIKVKLDHAEIRKMLQTAPRGVVNQAANEVAASVRGRGHKAEVEHMTTDRAVARVKTNFYDQAAHGALTKAAASVGLEVKTKR